MIDDLLPDRIQQGLVHLQQQAVGQQINFRLLGDYSMPNVSEKVVRIIVSYTD